MKTLAELKAFFESDLRPDLQDLESGRLRYLKKFRTLRFIVIGLLLCPAGLVLINEDRFSAIMFELMYLCGVFCFFGIRHSWLRNHYKAPEFKSRVIERIVKFIDPSMTYEPEGRVPLSVYAESTIFLREVDADNGDDLVTGSVGNTSFAFSELHTKYKSTHRDASSGGVETTFPTIFHGLFFYADFNKSFKGKTYVIPDHRVKRYGKVIGNYFRSRNKSHGELVKLEDPVFEKEFVVYGHDQVEARFILTPSLMKLICDFRKKTGKNTYLSFVNNRIFVAIEYDKDVFEADLYRPFIDIGLIREYYEDMAHAIGIVEDLNLNTKIWN